MLAVIPPLSLVDKREMYIYIRVKYNTSLIYTYIY